MEFWKEGTELISIPLRTADGEDHIVSLPQKYWDMLRGIINSGYMPINEVIDVAWDAVLLNREDGSHLEMWQALAYAIQVFHQRSEAERLGLLQDNAPNDFDSLPGRN